LIEILFLKIIFGCCDAEGDRDGREMWLGRLEEGETEIAERMEKER
jgi:hypothetical protein